MKLSKDPNVKACPHCDKTRITLRNDRDKNNEEYWHCYSCKKRSSAPLIRLSKGKGKRRIVEDSDELTDQEIFIKLSMYNPPLDYPFKIRDLAFVAILHECGPRISELIGTSKTPKLTLGQFHFEAEDELHLTLPILKLKTRQNKKLPIILSNNKNSKFITTYLRQFGEPDYDNPEELKKWKETELFKFGRIRGYQIVQKVLGKDWFPHFLRHQKVTDLVTKYDFSDTQTVRYMGWADGRPMSRYAHLRTSDLAQKIRNKKVRELEPAVLLEQI